MGITTEPLPDPYLETLVHVANSRVYSETDDDNSGIRLHLDGEPVLCVVAPVWALAHAGLIRRKKRRWALTTAGREALDEYAGAGVGAS